MSWYGAPLRSAGRLTISGWMTPCSRMLSASSVTRLRVEDGARLIGVRRDQVDVDLFDAASVEVRRGRRAGE